MTLADLVVKISAEGADGVVSSLMKIDQGIAQVSSQGAALGGMASAVGAAAAGFAALAAGVFAYGKAAVDAAIPLDSAKRALQSVSHSTKEYEQSLRDLQEAAKLPGLGFQEVVSGSVKLQGAGISAKVAKDSIVELGNAIANAGRGKAEFAAAVDQLAKMAGLGKVTADDMNEIAAYAPQFRAAFKDAFGTLDMEKFNKKGLDIETIFMRLNAQLREMPRAAISFQTAIDNLGDSFQVAMEPLGEGILNGFATLTSDSESFFNQLQNVNKELAHVMEQMGAFSGPIKINFQNTMLFLIHSWRDFVYEQTLAWSWLFETLQKYFNNIQKFMNTEINIKDILTGKGFPKMEYEKITPQDEYIRKGMAGYREYDAMAFPRDKKVELPDRERKIRDNETDKDTKESKNHLKQISANTGKTANALEFNRQLFGGRQLGQLGVTAVELGMSRDRFRGSTQIPGSTMINRGILQLVQQSQRQYLNTPLGRY
jgi:tape measure domain-containing protein